MNTSKRLPLYLVGGAGVSALAVTLAVAVSDGGSSAAVLSTAPRSTVVATRDTGLGAVLVDAQGRTLYLFAKDTGAASACTGSCTSIWPPVPVSGTPKAAGGATSTALGVITGVGGGRQLSYAGHPLYYYAGDHTAGQTNGQGLDQFGARWFVLNAGGGAVRAVPSTARGGDGYGY